MSSIAEKTAARKAGSIVTKPEDYMFSSQARHDAALRRLRHLPWGEADTGPGFFARLFGRR